MFKKDSDCKNRHCDGRVLSESEPMSPCQSYPKHRDSLELYARKRIDPNFFPRSDDRQANDFVFVDDKPLNYTAFLRIAVRNPPNEAQT